MKPLKELYELLWKQIKDRYCKSLNLETEELQCLGIINSEEEIKLDMDMENSVGYIFYSSQRKEFVQRRIKELTEIKK